MVTLNKLFYYFQFVLILLLVGFFNLCSQNVLQKNVTKTEERKKILILSHAGANLLPNSIDAEVTAVVANEAVNLKRFDVIDRTNLNQILEEQALQQSGIIDDSTAIRLGKIAASDEALVISVINFTQKGVKPEEDDDDDDDSSFGESLLKAIVTSIFSSNDDDSEPYANNIQTQLSVQVKKIDLISGESKDSYNVSFSYTGGSRGVSRGKVIEKFRKSAETELKKMYLLSSEVVSVDGNETLIALGSDAGVKKGIIFEIMEPDKIKTIKGKQFLIPGRSAGFVMVNGVSSETNRSAVVREWDSVRDGQRAVEYTGNALGIQIYSVFSNPQDYFYLGLRFMGVPIYDFNFGFSLRYNCFTDSYHDQDSGFGFSGFAGYRLYNISRLRFTGKIGLDVDFAFKIDDNDRTVSIPIVSVPVALNTSILISRSIDFDIELGYRLSGDVSGWSYTKGDNTYDAHWNDAAPRINISGFYIMAGFKFLIL